MKYLHHPPSPRKRCFTLIELMVVVCIIAVISALAIPAFSLVSSKARRIALKKERAKIETVRFEEPAGSSPVFDQLQLDYQL